MSNTEELQKPPSPPPNKVPQYPSVSDLFSSTTSDDSSLDVKPVKEKHWGRWIFLIILLILIANIAFFFHNPSPYFKTIAKLYYSPQRTPFAYLKPQETELPSKNFTGEKISIIGISYTSPFKNLKETKTESAGGYFVYDKAGIIVNDTIPFHDPLASIDDPSQKAAFLKFLNTTENDIDYGYTKFLFSITPDEYPKITDTQQTVYIVSNLQIKQAYFPKSLIVKTPEIYSFETEQVKGFITKTYMTKNNSYEILFFDTKGKGRSIVLAGKDITDEEVFYLTKSIRLN